MITSSIKHPVGANIPAVAADVHNSVCNILPVNGLGTAWFKRIEVKLNGTTVSFDGNMYSHRANIENRLSYPNTVKKGHLSMMGFDEEMVAFDQINNADIHWDNADPAEQAHPAILRRYLKGKTSKNMYTIAKIHSEIFEQPKLLPPNTCKVLLLAICGVVFVCGLLFLLQLCQRFLLLWLCIKLLGNAVRVYPRIVQGLTFLSA